MERQKAPIRRFSTAGFPIWLSGSALVFAAAGEVGLGAGSTVNMTGATNLFGFTNAILASCPGTAGPYVRGNDGSGQSAMISGAQQVAPMARFLDSATCSGAKAAPTQSDGLVVGLDGIAVVGSSLTAGSTACNGASNTGCDPTFEPGTGATYNTVVAGYTFNGWHDVLRVLLAGFTHDASGIGAAQWAMRDCNSAVRQAIANSYGNFFENHCSAPAGDATGGVCTQIRHIFRRDDFSETTETLVSLLGLPSVVYPETSVTVFPGGVSTTITQHTGADPFCNAVRPAFVMPQSASQPEPTCMQGADATWAPTSKNLGSGFCNPACAVGSVCDNGKCVAGSGVSASGLCGTGTSACSAGQICVSGTCTSITTACTSQSLTCCPSENSVYRATMQDNDPIRRTCFGAANGAAGTSAEDNCNHSGDLGLVLVMNDVPETGDVGTTSDPLRYNASPCVRSHFSSATAPDVYDNVTQAKQICTRGLLCPNGDLCTNTGGCIIPVDATGSVQCLANKLTAPATPSNNVPVPAAHPVNPGVAEGRAYNAHLYKTSGNAAAYQVNGFTVALPMTGAFYRIHTNHTLAATDAGGPSTCQLPDMASQIVCLASASPCSLGYTGGVIQALNSNTNVTSVKVNAQSALPLCIQQNFHYPVANKLYLNSVPGFPSLTGQELQLAGCETDLAQSKLSPATPASLVTNNITATGFIQIPPFNNGGEPFCEDFNEAALCAATTNIDACQNAAPNFSTFPAFDEICGNGAVEPYEDCDDGTSNGPPPASCSLTCRFN